MSVVKEGKWQHLEHQEKSLKKHAKAVHTFSQLATLANWYNRNSWYSVSLWDLNYLFTEPPTTAA